MLQDNYRMSTLDYGHLLDCTFKLERSQLAIDNVFRLACFNVLMHNKDDHSKNFGFLMDGAGVWKFAPCYDLTFSATTHGYRSTSVMGESKNVSEEVLEKLGKEFGIQYPRRIIEQVKETRSQWKTYAKNVGVSLASTTMIDKIFNTKN